MDGGTLCASTRGLGCGRSSSRVSARAPHKYEIIGPKGDLLPLKADPFGFQAERLPAPPPSSTIPRATRGGLGPGWEGRDRRNALDAPMAVYEVHLGSWRRNPDGSYYTYRQLADELVSYVVEMGYTHVEFLPPTEHPFDGSWGYQPLGLFAPTSRFGTPDDFKHLIDAFHRAGVGVLIDWVPRTSRKIPTAWLSSTAPTSTSTPTLARAGTPTGGRSSQLRAQRGAQLPHLQRPLLALRVPRRRVEGRRRSLDALPGLLARARRVGPERARRQREPRGWLPPAHERAGLRAAPGATTVAEESTAWPMVSRPVSMGGLGFGYKWNMGWMHDSLQYISQDPINRKYHHDEITFSWIYAFSENFVLPLSHDEVVHGMARS